MTSSTLPSRRSVIAGAGGLGLAAVLAACSSSGSPVGTPDDDGAAAPGIPAGTDLAAVADVPVGGALAVTVGSDPVLVTQPAEGEILAFSAVCTHERCTVAPGDGELRCPCHLSRYDLQTGGVLGGPAPAPLPEIAVTVADGRVLTA